MILVLGDSFTAGSGLRDYDPDNPPSSLCWASVLGQHLNVEVDNYAKAGLSNGEILERFFERYDPTRHSAVIILWSYLTRIYFPDPHNPETLISGRTHKPTNGPGNLNRLLESYYKYFYSDRVAAYQLAGFQQLVQSHCECPVLHDSVDYIYRQYTHLHKHINFVDPETASSFPTVWQQLGSKVGSQGHHYSEETHEVWAKEYVAPRLVQLGFR